MSISTHYCIPSSLEAAADLKSRLGSRGVILAGGTDLMLALPRPFEGTLIDLSAAGLDRVAMQGDSLHIGAMVTACRIATDPLVREMVPLLSLAAGELGSPQIRSRATIGGNAVNASPCADMMCALVALDAEALLVRSSGARRIPARDLTLGPGRSACAEDEILAGFDIRRQEGRGAFRKLGLRSAQAVAVTSIAAAGVTGADGAVASLAIACGSVAPRVVRADSVERALSGRHPERPRIATAARLVLGDISPISDIRASAGYRQAVTVVLLQRALEEVFPCV